MTRILFALLLLVSPLWTLSQSISGRIADEDNTAIFGAFVHAGNVFTQSGDDGRFSLILPDPRPEYLIVSSFGFMNDTIYLPDVEGDYRVEIVLKKSAEELENIVVTEKAADDHRSTEIGSRNLAALAGPQGGVEALIRTLPGVVGRSEFSSQYSVRGGSFDENLVYVNGIEVYRPFLVRSGQQEGMSFINSDLVDEIRFSAGGFGAVYGDKMSSVLDITYKEPDEFGGKVELSLLGANISAGGTSADKRFNAIGGIRYRSNRLLLGALDTDGDFTSNFADVQLLMNYRLNNRWKLSFFGNLADNTYKVVPGNRTTEFGTFQEALSLQIYFDGKEQYNYTTTFGAFSAEWMPRENMELNFYASAYQTIEEEDVDVIGAYLLSELNTDLGSDEFGEVRGMRGVGGFHQYARNELDAIIFNTGHRGVLHLKRGDLYWGVRIQREDIVDRYKEWEFIDSAGYSVPNQPTQVIITPGDTMYISDDQLEIWESFDTRGSVASFRSTAYVEYGLPWAADSNHFRLNVGLRAQHWSLNQQITASPRASISWIPGKLKKWLFKAAAGVYHQPAFYREMRDLHGDINREIRAQRAIHYVLGGSYSFIMFDRPFVLNNEVYYKQMDNLVPYELDNVRIRYSAKNEAKGYAYGLDARINGEFVKGVESWASLSLFRVKEDLINDQAGYLPRPTDQLYSFALFFQDYLPKFPTFRVNINLVVTGGFPFGPPQTERSEHLFRSGPYRRLDLGFIKVLRVKDKAYKNAFYRNIEEFWIGLEVFNMLATRNTVSYLWVRDISTANQYAVPNYLTSRLLNLKVHIAF